MPSSIDTIEKIQKNAKVLQGYHCNEADTIRNFIDPVLDFLQYPSTHQRRESQQKQNRPDIVLWDSPDKMKDGSPATLILEAKRLGADLNGNGKAKQDRPKEQLSRYLTGYERSGPATLGILTDGNYWSVVRAVPSSPRTIVLKEVRLLDGPLETATNNLNELHKLILDSNRPVRARNRFASNGRQFTNAISDEKSPSEVLSLLVDVQDISTDLGKIVALEGTAKHVVKAYWDSYAFAPAGRILVDRPSIFGDDLCVAIVRMKNAKDENDRIIYRPDVATAASIFAKTRPTNMSIVVVIQPDEDGDSSSVRLAVHHQGHTSMTVSFNPYAPPPHILKKIQSLYDKLKRSEPVRASVIADVVAAQIVRRQYYKDITEGWVFRQYDKLQTDDLNKRRQYREAILRHLMRTLFVWILKEEGKLPQEVFEPEFARQHAPENYHKEVLTHLFHDRLNIPFDMRVAHPVKEINSALQDTRFLNGSLFARHRYDDILNISNTEYFGEDSDSLGLFTILSKYEWTATEHTASHSDQTIDPEVLSNLFENLIAVTEFNETPDRMPGGTYYTPADVAKEMAKDAMMLAIAPVAPSHWSEKELLMLFDEEATSVSDNNIEPGQKRDLIRRISNLTVFDPSVGSGVFLLSVLTAIRASLQHLGENDDDGRLTRRIISQQLYAQDLSPIAVQITRLRLAIAIIAAEGEGTHPLPNLESRIVCANTLCTIPNRDWSISTAGGFQDASPAIVAALSKRAELLDSWQDAHDESAKLALRKKDEKLREHLKYVLQDGVAREETIAFADFSLLDPDASPAHTDPRLIFYRSDWDGFDVVIGNPPYEKIPKSTNSNEIKRLKDGLRARRYSTIPCYDLYASIAEAGLSLARPEGGVVSLIVPLSICFGEDKQSLRDLVEQNSSRIWLRSHDNRPNPVFKKSPVTHPESRQRTTILNAVMTRSKKKPTILVSGINRWLKSERHLFLASRSNYPRPEHKRGIDTRLSNQWERIPTREIANLISTMQSSRYNLESIHRSSMANESVGFPKTASVYVG